MNINDKKNAIEFMGNLISKLNTSNGDIKIDEDFFGKLVSDAKKFRENAEMNIKISKRMSYLNQKANFLNEVAAKIVNGELLDNSEFVLAVMLSEIVLAKRERVVNDDSFDKLTLKQQYLIFMEDVLSVLPSDISIPILKNITLSNFVNIANLLGLYEELSTNSYHQNYQKLEIIGEKVYSQYVEKFNQISLEMEQVEKKKQETVSIEGENTNDMPYVFQTPKIENKAMDIKNSGQIDNEKQDDVVVAVQDGVEDSGGTAEEVIFNFNALEKSFNDPVQKTLKENEEYVRLLDYIRECFGELNPINVSMALYEKVKFDVEEVSMFDIVKMKRILLIMDDFQKRNAQSASK